VVSAASDETYLRPNGYCQLAPARRDGAAWRKVPPQTCRLPVATGAADGPPGPAWHQSHVPGVMPAAQMKASRLLALADTKGLLLRIISRRNEQH